MRIEILQVERLVIKCPSAERMAAWAFAEERGFQIVSSNPKINRHGRVTDTHHLIAEKCSTSDAEIESAIKKIGDAPSLDKTGKQITAKGWITKRK